MRLKLQFEGLGERADHQRLGQSGHADQQTVPPRENADQHLVDDGLLPDDAFAQLRAQTCVSVGQSLQHNDVVTIRPGVIV